MFALRKYRKMGVKQFNSTFVSRNIPASLDAMRDTCAAVAIDTNQFIHQALGKLIKEICVEKEPDDKTETYILKPNFRSSSTDSLHAIYTDIAKDVLDTVINELYSIKNLREVFVTMDGTPCYGKIQNQIVRRRNPKRIIKSVLDIHGKKTEKLVLSSAHIIPGTPLMNAFTTALRAKIDEFSTERKDVSITLSLTDIPGEGEHKALDYLTASPYTSFNRVENTDGDQGKRFVTRSFLIWSNDSDVIISLLHRAVANVYVMTDVNTPTGTSLKCISLSTVRESICQERHDVLNAPLLLAFAGNDYLPEMFNTLDIKAAYNRMRELCNSTDLSEPLCLTKDAETPKFSLQVRESDEVMPVDAIGTGERVQQKAAPRTFTRIEYGSYRVIDTTALCKFLRMMAEEEIQSYYPTLDQPRRGLTRTLRIPPDPDYTRNPVAFKRKYYRVVHKDLARIQASPINPRIEGEPTDSELYDLEMELATAYLRTYYWYYYYQSGMTSGPNMDNTFYPYVHPPLYSSLFIVLDRAKREQMINFDYTYNSSLQPVPRDLDYFKNLPVFTSLHQYIVLQPKDYELLLEQMGVTTSPFKGLNIDRGSEPINSLFARSRSTEMIELNKSVNISYLVDTYKEYVAIPRTDTIKLGPIDTDRRIPRKNISDRYKVKEVVSM
jgi:hypothetical protein